MFWSSPSPPSTLTILARNAWLYEGKKDPLLCTKDNMNGWLAKLLSVGVAVSVGRGGVRGEMVVVVVVEEVTVLVIWNIVNKMLFFSFSYQKFIFSLSMALE